MIKSKLESIRADLATIATDSELPLLDPKSKSPVKGESAGGRRKGGKGGRSGGRGNKGGKGALQQQQLLAARAEQLNALAGSDDESDDDARCEESLRRVPEKLLTEIEAFCLQHVQPCMLLLYLKQHLQFLYSITDAYALLSIMSLFSSLYTLQYCI